MIVFTLVDPVMVDTVKASCKYYSVRSAAPPLLRLRGIDSPSSHGLTCFVSLVKPPPRSVSCSIALGDYRLSAPQFISLPSLAATKKAFIAKPAKRPPENLPSDPSATAASPSLYEIIPSHAEQNAALPPPEFALFLPPRGPKDTKLALACPPQTIDPQRPCKPQTGDGDGSLPVDWTHCGLLRRLFPAPQMRRLVGEAARQPGDAPRCHPCPNPPRLLRPRGPQAPQPRLLQADQRGGVHPQDGRRCQPARVEGLLSPSLASPHRQMEAVSPLRAWVMGPPTHSDCGSGSLQVLAALASLASTRGLGGQRRPVLSPGDPQDAGRRCGRPPSSWQRC